MNTETTSPLTEPEPPPRRGPGRPPGFQGASNRNIQYHCTQCGAQESRDTLFSKRAVWSTIGSNPKAIRIRTIAWVCEKCMNADPDFQRESRTQAPGNKDIYAPAKAPEA